MYVSNRQSEIIRVACIAIRNYRSTNRVKIIDLVYTNQVNIFYLPCIRLTAPRDARRQFEIIEVAQFTTNYYFYAYRSRSSTAEFSALPANAILRWLVIDLPYIIPTVQKIQATNSKLSKWFIACPLVGTNTPAPCYHDGRAHTMALSYAR